LIDDYLFFLFLSFGAQKTNNKKIITKKKNRTIWAHVAFFPHKQTPRNFLNVQMMCKSRPSNVVRFFHLSILLS